MHKDIYPHLYANDSMEDNAQAFKASVGWQKKFCDRNNFRMRVVTRAKKSMQSKEEMCETIKEFHIETRIFQMETINDPVYGLTGPQCVFNRDQIPIELRAKKCTTIDDKGVSVHLVVVIIEQTPMIPTLADIYFVERRHMGRGWW